MIDPSSANCFIKENIAINSFAYETESPVELMKAIKNPIETENIESAHIKDGVAVTKFVRWLTENVKKGTVTEISAAEKLDEFRKMGEGYIGQSFAPTSHIKSMEQLSIMKLQKDGRYHETGRPLSY